MWVPKKSIFVNTFISKLFIQPFMQIKQTYIRLAALLLCLLWPSATKADNFSTILKKALSAFDQQNFEVAQQEIETLLQQNGAQKSVAALYYKGIIYDQLMRKNITIDDLAQNYLTEAMKAYHQVLEIGKTYPQFYSFTQINIKDLWAYYLNRGVQYYKVEAFEEALEQFTISESIQGGEPIVVLYKAISAHQMENYELALAFYQQYVAQQSQQDNGVPPNVYRALAHLTANYAAMPEAAYQIIVDALGMYPWDINLLEEKYQIVSQQNLLLVQKEKLSQSIIETPHNPIFYYQQAYFYQKEKDYSQAINAYEQAILLAPKQLEPTLQLGLLYCNQASETLQQTIEMDEELYQSQGLSYLNTAHQLFTQSLTYLEKAHRMDRKNLFILHTLYRIYTRLQQLDQAKRIKQKMKLIKGGMQLLNAEAEG